MEWKVRKIMRSEFCAPGVLRGGSVEMYVDMYRSLRALKAGEKGFAFIQS